MEMIIRNMTLNNGIKATIKEGTFHYSASAGSREQASIFCVFGSYVEFEYYVGNGFTVSVGDRIAVTQNVYVDKTFNDTYPTAREIYMFPSFYVKEIKAKKDSVYVIAYDCVTKLDVDYSQRLKSLESSFPMKIGDLYNDVILFAGLTSTLSPSVMQSNIAASTVGYFYAAGITAREIVSSIISLFARPLFAFSSTSVEMINYGNSGNVTAWNNISTYVICPGDGTYYQSDGVTVATNVWYKQDGLSINGDVASYDGVEIISSDGMLLGSAYSATPAANIYRVKGNIIIENINAYSPATYTADNIASFLLNCINASYMPFPYVSAKVEVFPFRSPYIIGTTARVVDTNGNYYNVPVMSLDITDNAVVIESFNLTENNSTNPAYSNDNTSALWAKVNKLESIMPPPIHVITVTGTTNQYGNIATGLDANCSILSVRRTDSTSICVPLWGAVGNAEWYAHVMGNTAAAVTSTHVSLEVVYIQGVYESVYYLTDSNGNNLVDHSGNNLTITV